MPATTTVCSAVTQPFGSRGAALRSCDAPGTEEISPAGMRAWRPAGFTEPEVEFALPGTNLRPASLTGLATCGDRLPELTRPPKAKTATTATATRRQLAMLKRLNSRRADNNDTSLAFWASRTSARGPPGKSKP